MSMIHRVHSTELSEINRILELIKKKFTSASSAKTTTNALGQTVLVSSSAASSTVITTPIVPIAPPTTTTTTVPETMTGMYVFPEILLDPSGDVMTDENGFALVGVRVESMLMTGAGDTIQEMAFDVATVTPPSGMIP